MTIPELKAIAAQYGVHLHPIAVLESHCLEYDGTNKGRHEDKKLLKMTEAEFTELCKTAVKPPEVRHVPFDPVQWEQEHERPRHILTGHYR